MSLRQPGYLAIPKIHGFPPPTEKGLALSWFYFNKYLVSPTDMPVNLISLIRVLKKFIHGHGGKVQVPLSGNVRSR